MRPRTDEILRSVLWTFDEWIVPEATTPFAKSLTLTMGNLLRHVTLRVELEGDLLFEDNRELRAVLGRVADYAERATVEQLALGDLCMHLNVVLGRTFWGGDVYPSVARLVEEAMALRGALSDALRVFLARRDVLRDDAGYQVLRREIRDYLGRQLQREGQMIEPAFTADRR
ncbi:MAG: hypothetical protein GC201_02645 [Alphaproteobacteria bacterium]|nr:hypothetical protein [Alphaproteobacteria bacterium]